MPGKADLAKIAVGIALLAAVAAPLILFLLFKTEREPGVLARCDELKAQRAALGAQAELQPNRGRPTLTINLADRLWAFDDITFGSKERVRIPDGPKLRTSARFIDTPRRSADERIDSRYAAEARPVVGGTAVELAVCVSRGGRLTAGAFQGTVRIYGPRVNDFDYAVVVNQKWPWQTAVATLWYAGLAFVIVAMLSGSLTFDPARTGLSKWGASAAGVVFALVAMAPTFFGAYWNNRVWGSEPWTHVGGLAAAGFTAAFAGLAAAQKFIKKPTPEESADARQQKAAEQAAKKRRRPPRTGRGREN